MRSILMTWINCEIIKNIISENALSKTKNNAMSNIILVKNIVVIDLKLALCKLLYKKSTNAIKQTKAQKKIDYYLNYL